MSIRGCVALSKCPHALVCRVISLDNMIKSTLISTRAVVCAVALGAFAIAAHLSNQPCVHKHAYQSQAFARPHKVVHVGRSDTSLVTRSWAGSPIVIQPLKIVYCGIPKNACTLVKRFAMRASGGSGWNSQASDGRVHNPRKNGLLYMRDMEFEAAQNVLQDPGWTKLVVIRDPIVRFAAGFLDKCARVRYNTAGQQFVDGNCPVRDVACSQNASKVLDSLEKNAASRGLANLNGHFRPQSMFCDLQKIAQTYVAVEMDGLSSSLSNIITTSSIPQWTKAWGLAAWNQTLEFVKSVNHDTSSRDLAARWIEEENACVRDLEHGGVSACDELIAVRLRKLYKDDFDISWRRVSFN